MGAMIGVSENTSEQIKKRPAPSTAWKPGQSGNPGGRPRVVADIRALAQAEGDACIAALKRVMDDPKSPAAAKVQAAQALLDRGYGRAIQRQELSGPDGAPIQVQQVPDDRPTLDGFLVEFSEQPADYVSSGRVENGAQDQRLSDDAANPDRTLIGQRSE